MCLLQNFTFHKTRHLVNEDVLRAARVFLNDLASVPSCIAINVHSVSAQISQYQSKFLSDQ